MFGRFTAVAVIENECRSGVDTFKTAGQLAPVDILRGIIEGLQNI